MRIVAAITNANEIQLAIKRGEKVSEYRRAWAYADLMMPTMIKWLNAGMSRSDVITSLAMATGVRRAVAAEAVCKKLKKIGYVPKVADEDEDIPDCPVEPKAKPAKSEVSKEILVKREANTVTPVAATPVSAPRPVQPVVTAKPVPRPAQAPTSASTESNQVPSKKLVLDFSKMPGANSFLGEPGYGPSQEEKELRAKAQANLDRMEREHGSPLDQARKINQQGEAK